ncbi:hypothetical protein BDV18DRAFT_58050 [Aspergillus unguis]
MSSESTPRAHLDASANKTIATAADAEVTGAKRPREEDPSPPNKSKSTSWDAFIEDLQMINRSERTILQGPFPKQDSQEDSPPKTKDEEIEILKQRIQVLEEENLGWEEIIEQNEITKNTHAGWCHSPPGEWRMLISMNFEGMGRWGRRYGLSSTEDLLKLSTKQKQELVASLSGYCIQEDLETIVSGVAPHMRNNLPAWFIQMFLVKDILAKFYANPFWYLQSNTLLREARGPEPEKVLQVKSTPLGEELNHLLQRFMKTNPHLATAWRSETVRLCTTYNAWQGADFELGHELREKRETAVKSMVGDILANKCLQSLLKKGLTASEKKSMVELLEVTYQTAAKTATEVSHWPCWVKFHTLDDIPPAFHHGEDRTEAEWTHMMPLRDDRLDGQRIIGIRSPAVSICRELMDVRKDVVLRAPAIIETQWEGGTFEERQAAREKYPYDHLPLSWRGAKAGK